MATTTRQSGYRIVEVKRGEFSLYDGDSWCDTYDSEDKAKAEIERRRVWDQEWDLVEARTHQFIKDLARELGRPEADIAEYVCQAAA